MKSKKKYMQFGSGDSTPPDFINFDSSPNLYLQRNTFTKLFWRHQVKYPDSIQYGNILKALPIEDNSLKGIYSSHVLEHLSYNECKLALSNSYRYLAEGGIFRCVLPNLELQVNAYLEAKRNGDVDASVRFMEYSFLGYKDKPSNLMALLRWYYTTDNHYWMWDDDSLTHQLKKTGFKEVYKSGFGQSKDPMFNQAENEVRFSGSIVLEAIK